MTTILYPNTELVAVAWLKTYVVPGVGVGTTLPQDNSTWAASGFLQVSSAGAGSSEPYYPLEHPVVTIDAWATRPGSDKPPWGQAINLIEAVRMATRNSALMNKVLDLQSGFPQARFLTAQMVMQPARIPDPTSYARYSARFLLHWTLL